LRVEGNRFLISGSGTGSSRVLGEAGYSLVCAFSPEKNEVVSLGAVQASSEAMTHGAIYQANPAVRCVIHVHSQEGFARLLRQGWAHTPQDAAYGTPELSRAVEALVKTDSCGVFVTAGHAEGLFAYGTTVQDALESLLRHNPKGQGNSK
ncbi:MAG: class II aldolase/adducin family protein, partial [Bilophila sp.]